MAQMVLDRAVLELGVDGSKLFSETEKAVKGLAARVKQSLGKDLSSAFSGIEDAVGGFKDLTGASNPLAKALDGVVGKAKAVGAGFTAMGPVAGGIAVALGAISAAALAVVAAIGATGVAIYNAARSAADAGDELNTLSNRFGMTAESLSTLKFIAAQADVPFETLTNSIFKLGQNLSEGGKKAQAATKLIGTSIAELRQQSPEQAFQTVITGLANIPDAGQRAAAGVALFGKQFKDIAQLTQEDMDALAQKARESGAVMSQEFAVAGDRFNDAMATVGKAIDGVVNRFGAAFLPMGIALVETFQVHLTAALGTASKGMGDFAKTVADVSVIIGQALAAVVSVGADAVGFFTHFFAGTFIQHFGLVELIGSVVTALGRVLTAAGAFNQAFAEAGAAALASGQWLEDFGEKGAKATVRVSAEILKYASAVQDAATMTGVTLPAAVERVRREIEEQAKKAREGIAANKGFGASLGEDVTEGADKAAAALKKVNAERAELLGEARAVGMVLDDFASRFQDLEADMDAFTASLPILEMGDLMTQVDTYAVDVEVAAAKTGLLERAFETLGMTSTAELQRIAQEARTAWQVIVEEFGERSPEAQAAYQKMVDAVNAATRTIPSVWQSEVWPGIKNALGNVREDIAATFADALVHITSWKDAAIEVFRSFQRAVADILTQILDDFLNRFVKGLTNALTGRGGFADAFGGFLPGLFGGGGGLTNTAGVGSPIWNAAAGMPPGVGAGATPWWSTAVGGGLIGGAAGGAAGWVVGDQTGNRLGSAGAGAGVGAGVGAIFGGPVGAGIGALIGAGVGWYSAMRENMRANDDRDQFFLKYAADRNQPYVGGAQAGSTFHDVAAQLTAAGHGEGGGQLFQDLINANDTEAVAKAIEAVNKALAEYAARTGAATQAEEAHSAALEGIRAQHQARIDELKAESAEVDKRRAEWDALEAPEEVMGAVEAAARAELDQQQQAIQTAIEEQQRAMEAALAGATTAATAAGAGIGAGIGGGFDMGKDAAIAFADWLAEMGRSGAFRVPLTPELGALGVPPLPAVPAARGFDGMVHRPTLFLTGEAGSEHVKVTPGGAPSGGGITVVVLPHGGTVRDVLNVLPKEAKRNEGQFGAKLSAALAPYGVR
jgi:hypothetical protein